MRYFLSIRLKQAYRLLREAGWGILLVLLVVTAGLWVPALDHLALAPASATLVLGLFLGGSIHLTRSDSTYLAKLTIPAWNAYLTDLGLALIPLALLLLLLGSWLPAISVLGGLIVIFLPPGMLADVLPKKVQITLFWIPRGLFELQASLRRFLLAWILVVILQFGAWYHIGFFLVSMALSMLILAGSFEHLEPKELLPVSGKALLQKWRKLALSMHAFFLPAYLQVLIWQVQHIWLFLYALIALETLLALAYFYKYSIWRPGLRRLSGSIYVGIGMLLILLPGGIIVALPLAIWVAIKAWRHINYWWNLH